MRITACDRMRGIAETRALYVPWPVVLDVVLLNFLHMMVRLWVVHALGVFPRKVADQTYGRQGDDRKPEPRATHDDRQCVDVFRAEVQLGRDESVYWQEDEPDRDTTRDGKDSVFRPDVGDQGSLRKHCHETCRVHGSAPYPVASNLAI